MEHTLAMLALAAFGLSLGYVGCAIACVVRFRRRLDGARLTDTSEPVTLLKPLCGLEQDLADNLRSFCKQDYATYQIVFGVQDRSDPAIAIVHQIMREFPERDITLVVDDRAIGANQKVGNLAHMARAAKHDILILSDGDMRVTPDYIRAMVAPFAAPKVGATTALYSGTGCGGLPSLLGAMYINDWFYPSSLIAVTFAELTYCFGATIAVRRKILDEIGGFAALADYIADDHMLGRFVHEAGYTVALAPYVIENIVHERSLRTLFLQEVRWARTIRSLRPVGYTCSAITELLAISIVASAAVFAASGSWVLAGMPVSTALAARYLLHRVVWDSQPNGGTYAPWLIPLRDLFGLTVRLASYLGSTVHWRGQVLNIGRRSVSRGEPRPAVSSDGGPYGI